MITRRSLLASAAAAPLVVPASVALAQEASPAAGLDVTLEAGVAYGEVDGEELLLDIYRLPDQDRPRPAVLVFHPGGMMVGDRSWMADDARALAALGYVTCSVDYRLFDGVGRNPWPAQLDDAQLAVRWLRANADAYGIGPERVGAYGYSAGGLLAAHLASRDTREGGHPGQPDTSSRVACAVALVAHTDATVAELGDSDSAANPGYFGGTPAEAPDVYQDWSVVSHVDGDTAPMLILHGINDTWTSVEHSRHLAAALQAADVESVYAELAGMEHLDWTWATHGSWMTAFLARQLRPEA